MTSSHHSAEHTHQPIRIPAPNVTAATPTATPLNIPAPYQQVRKRIPERIAHPAANR